MRSASNASLSRSLHILGPILGRKMGVKVTIGGSRACTDGNVIHLPSLPIEDNEAAILGFGHLFHEANHVRETDFSVDQRSGFVRSLVGALEDIRIDALGFQRYPGGVRDREQLIDLLVRRESAKSAKAGDSPAAILETYLFCASSMNCWVWRQHAPSRRMRRPCSGRRFPKVSLPSSMH